MTEETCLFCNIINGTIQTEFLYEDDVVVAFADIHPKKPVHVLIIPKKHVPNLLALEDDEVLNHIKKATKQLVESTGLSTKGFKLEINGGGLQDIEHLHAHLMGPYTKA